MYAATKYHSQPLQFINKYYFQVKSTMDVENYRTIIIILVLMTVLPLTLTLAFSPFTVLHIFPIVFRLLENDKVKVKAEYYEDKGIIPINPTKKDYYKKVIHLVPLTLTGIGMYISFVVIHIFSIIELLQYGNEVLNINYLPIAYAVISLLAVITGFVLSVIILVIKILRSKKDNNYKNSKKQNIKLTAAVISVNLFYLGCYFLPHMLLAFIHDPLRSIFTYLMVVFIAICLYLIFLGIWLLCKYRCMRCRKDKKFKLAKCCDTLLYSCMTWAMALSIMLFLFLTIFIIESFDDFQKLQNLTPSIIATVFTVILLTPAYNYLEKQLEDGNHHHNTMDRQEGRKQNQPGAKDESTTTTIFINELDQNNPNLHQQHQLDANNRSSISSTTFTNEQQDQNNPTST